MRMDVFVDAFLELVMKFDGIFGCAISYRKKTCVVEVVAMILCSQLSEC